MTEFASPDAHLIRDRFSSPLHQIEAPRFELGDVVALEESSRAYCRKRALRDLVREARAQHRSLIGAQPGERIANHVKDGIRKAMQAFDLADRIEVVGVVANYFDGSRYGHPTMLGGVVGAMSGMLRGYQLAFHALLPDCDYGRLFVLIPEMSFSGNCIEKVATKV